MSIRILIISVVSVWVALASTPVLSQGYTSDEKGATRCPQGSHVTSLTCEGRYCDNIYINCGGKNGGEWGPRLTTDWVENAGRKTAYCARTGSNPDQSYRAALDGVMAGIGCSGDFCDNIQLECAKLAKLVPDFSQCRTRRDISEEKGRNSIRISPSEAIVAITCSGQHCDNKAITYCKLIARRK